MVNTIYTQRINRPGPIPSSIAEQHVFDKKSEGGKMIKYKKIGDLNYHVFLDNKKVGSLRIASDSQKTGWAYFPTESDNHGDIFIDIRDAKKSLEMD
jgi:hypothetical protein